MTMVHEVTITKYTLDGYDFFDTREDAWVEEQWQIAWRDCKAYRAADGWHLVSGEDVIWTIYDNYFEKRIDERDYTAEEMHDLFRRMFVTAIELVGNEMRVYVE